MIPTHNRARLLPKSVGSVLAQTYADLEVIIVDDASSDNTGEVVKGMADERVRYKRHESNRGAPAARNTGILAARGQFVAFQDSDDEWLPGKLEKQMQAFAAAPPEVGVVYTGFWRMAGGVRTYIPGDNIKHKEGHILGELLRENFVTTPAMVVRRECFDKAGLFDEDLPRFQDWELAIRLAKNYLFRLIDEPLLVSAWQEDSISTNQSALTKALRLIVEKHLPDYEATSRRLLSSKYYSIGTLLCREGDFGGARQYMLRSLKAHPFAAGHWPAILMVSLLGGRAYLDYLGFKGRLFGAARGPK